MHTEACWIHTVPGAYRCMRMHTDVNGCIGSTQQAHQGKPASKQAQPARKQASTASTASKQASKQASTASKHSKQAQQAQPAKKLQVPGGKPQKDYTKP